MMIEELIHHPVFRESADHLGLPILIISSLFRDDFPWIYELGMQLYRAITDGSRNDIDRASRTMMASIEVMHHSKFMHEFIGGPGDDEAMVMLHHTMRDLDRYISEIKPRGKSAAGSDKPSKE